MTNDDIAEQNESATEGVVILSEGLDLEVIPEFRFLSIGDDCLSSKTRALVSVVKAKIDDIDGRTDYRLAIIW